MQPIGFRVPTTGSGGSPQPGAYLINEALRLAFSVTSYHVSQWLHETFPDRALVEGSHSRFNLERYARGGQCEIAIRTVPYPQRISRWDQAGGELGTVRVTADQAWFDVTWRGTQLDVLIMHWEEGRRPSLHFFILADDTETATCFLKSVCSWNSVPHDEILVFDGYDWKQNKKLFRSIRGARFDTLILAGSLKDEIRSDAATFFASRETYERHGAPWKRGLLLFGSPGNGKTHALKALVNELARPCLYVKSFRHSGAPDEESMQTVFDQARKSAPCVLIFEDLDALVTKRNRSFFLNELDGFAGNEGILTLATSNHPERLDPAIVDHPSRFDRKYCFDLPGPEERRMYIAAWSESVGDDIRLPVAAIAEVAERTEGFSFAYLKELCLSALMQWIAAPREDAIDSILLDQVEILRQQIATKSRKKGKKRVQFQEATTDNSQPRELAATSVS